MQVDAAERKEGEKLLRKILPNAATTSIGCGARTSSGNSSSRFRLHDRIARVQPRPSSRASRAARPRPEACPDWSGRRSPGDARDPLQGGTAREGVPANRIRIRLRLFPYMPRAVASFFLVDPVDEQHAVQVVELVLDDAPQISVRSQRERPSLGLQAWTRTEVGGSLPCTCREC